MKREGGAVRKIDDEEGKLVEKIRRWRCWTTKDCSTSTVVARPLLLRPSRSQLWKEKMMQESDFGRPDGVPSTARRKNDRDALRDGEIGVSLLVIVTGWIVPV